MRKKNSFVSFLLTAILLLSGTSATWAQATLTVADGTEENSNLPYDGWNLDNSSGQQRQWYYPAGDLTLMNNGLISSMSFYAKNASTKLNNQNTKFYIGTPDGGAADIVASRYVSTDVLIEVYSGPVLLPEASGDDILLTVNFDTPFLYTGGDLVITFVATDKGAYERVYFYGVTTSDQSGLGGTPNNINAFYSFTPKTTFSYTPGELPEKGMAASKSKIEFPMLKTGESTTATMKVTNVGSNPLTITSVNAEAPFSVAYNEGEVASLESAELTFTFAPTEGGLFSQEVTISTTSGDATVTLSGEGFQVPDTYYIETFDGISESSKLPLGWGSIETMDDYTIVDNNGDKGLAFNTSNPVFDYGSYESIPYLIVSPKVSGQVIAFVKNTVSSGSVKIYYCGKNGTTFSRGAEITRAEFTPALNTTDYSIVRFDVPEDGRYIGFQLSRAEITYFAAAERSTVRELTIGTSSFSESVVFNAENKAEVSYKFDLTNAGTVPVQADEYQLVTKTSNGDTLAITSGVDVPVGATVSVERTAMYSRTQPNNDSERFGLIVTETYTPNTKTLGWVTAYGPEGKLTITPVTIDKPTDLEIFRGERSATYSLRNNGKSDLVISAINTQPGVTHSWAEETFPVTLAVEETRELVVTIATPGNYSGAVVEFEHNGVGVSAINMTAACLPESMFYEGFENGLPENWLTTGDKWSASDRSTSSTYSPKRTDHNLVYMAHSTSGNPEYLITPRLTASDNDSIQFSVFKRAAYSKLSVYYSPDRSSWVLAKEIDMDQDLYSEMRYSAQIPAGDWFIGFLGEYVGFDEVFGLTEAPALPHDLLLQSFTGNALGTVNYTSDYTVELRNLTGEEDLVTVHFFDNEVEIASEERIIVQNETFTFSYTPYSEGEHKLQAVVKAGEDYEIRSAVITVTVAPERAENTLVVNEPGEDDSLKSNSQVPIRTNYCHSASQLLYTAEDLAGLSAGTEITRIGFYYGFSGLKQLDYDVRVWIGNSEKTEFTNEDNRISIEGMTQIFDGKITLVMNGSYDDGNVLSFELPEPMVYDGKSISIVMSADSTGYGQTISFMCKSSFDPYKLIQYSVDGSEHTLVAPERFETQNASTYQGLPTLVVYTKNEPAIVTGTVRNRGEVLPDATLTFQAGNVKYNGTTDTEGAYQVTIFQPGDYTVTIAKDGNMPYEVTDPVSVAKESLVKDFDVELETGIEVARQSEVKVYVDRNAVCHIEASDRIENVRVVSAGGKLVSATRHNENAVSVDMSSVASGIYVVSVTTEAGTSVYKVSKR